MELIQDVGFENQSSAQSKVRALFKFLEVNSGYQLWQKFMQASYQTLGAEEILFSAYYREMRSSGELDDLLYEAQKTYQLDKRVHAVVNDAINGEDDRKEYVEKLSSGHLAFIWQHTHRWTPIRVV